MDKWNGVSLSDLIRPIGSVYFSENSHNFDPVEVFGGIWYNPGTITLKNTVYQVWRRVQPSNSQGG